MAHPDKQPRAYWAPIFPVAQRSIDFRTKLPDRPQPRTAPKAEEAKNSPSKKPVNPESGNDRKP